MQSWHVLNRNISATTSRKWSVYRFCVIVKVGFYPERKVFSASIVSYRQG
jgi:hypothetical protein